MATIRITGKLIMPNGEPAQFREVLFKRMSPDVSPTPGGGVVVDTIRAWTDINAEIDVELVPGRYVGEVADARGRINYNFAFIVTGEEPGGAVTLEVLLSTAQFGDPVPYWFSDVSGSASEANNAAAEAKDARDEAEQARDEALIAADIAQDAVSYQYLVDTVAALASVVPPPTTGGRAFVRENEHVYTYNGTSWVDNGLAPTAAKADKAALAAEVVQRENLDSRITGYVGSTDARDVDGPITVGVKNLANQVAGITNDLTFVGLGVELFDLGAEDRDAGGEITPVISGVDVDGIERVIFGLDVGGKPVIPGFNPSSEGVEWRPPTEMRGDWGQFNVRQTPDFTWATVQTNGVVTDVMQRRSFTVNNSAIPYGPIGIIGCIGQSNAGAGSGPSGPPPIVNLGWPHHVLKTEGSYGLYGTSDFAATLAGRTQVIGYTEPTSEGQSPAGMMGMALAYLDGWRSKSNPTSYFTAWEGDRPITAFFPGAVGSWNHENMVNGIKALNRVITPYTDTKLEAMLFIQGENASPDYANLLRSWIDDVLPLYGEGIGQGTPHMLLRQINRAANAAGAGTYPIPQQQLEVARERLGAGVTMTGPMYQMPLHDSIHANNIGRMLGGEQDALAWQAARDGTVWHPLWPVSGGVTRSGVTVTVPFELPKGRGGLKFDTDWVLPVANNGFVYADDSASGITVTNVAISGSNVVITLSGDPGSAANQRIEYAIYNAPATGWASARGHLYVDSGIDSPFYNLGFDVPETIRLYSVRFSEVIS